MEEITKNDDFVIRNIKEKEFSNTKVKDFINDATEVINEWQTITFKNQENYQFHNDLLISFKHIQDAMDYLNKNLLQKYITSFNIGYLAGFSPFRNSYFGLAKINDKKWLADQNNAWDLWFKKTSDLNIREKSVEEGKLFDHVAKLNFYEIAFLKWDNDKYVSKALQILNLKYGLLVPILFKQNFIGLLTVGFDNLRSAIESAAYLYKFANHILLPLLLPFTVAMEEELFVDETCNLFMDTMDKFDNGLLKAKQMWNSLKQEDKTSEKFNEIIGIIDDTIKITEKYEKRIIKINDFKLEKKSTIMKDLPNIIEESLNVLKEDILIPFRNRIDMKFIDIVCDEEIRLPISSERLRFIFEEIILNSFKAIEDRRDFIMEKEDISKPDNPNVINLYAKYYGNQPSVAFHVYKQNDISIMDIYNNGEKMTLNIFRKASNLGFSTRDGSGIGLTIIRRNILFNKGSFKIFPPATYTFNNNKSYTTKIQICFNEFK